MEENNNHKVKLAEHSKDINYIKKDLAEIKSQVSNHLPSKICSMKNKFNERFDGLEKEFNDFKLSNKTWLIGILLTMIFLLVASLLNFIK